MSRQKKEAIYDAEVEIAEILEDLERDHNVRAHHIIVVSNRTETPLITITPDMQGGSL